MEIKKRLSAKLPLASRPPVGKVLTVRVGTDAHADRPQRAFWKGLMCASVPSRTGRAPR